MKRSIALLLTVIVIVISLPLTGFALRYAEYDSVLSAYATVGFSYSTTKAMNESIEYVDAYPYFHFAPEAGTYANNDLVFIFKPLNTLLSEKPVIKVSYRTNTPAARLDVSMHTSEGEKWMNTHPLLTSDGEWNTLTFNYNNITGSTVAFPDADDTDVTIRLKPFGSQSYTLGNNVYFDINYIALFETEAEAAAFEYNDLSPAQYEYNVLTAEALYYEYSSGIEMAETAFTRVDSNNSYLRYIAQPGTYTNNQLIVTFSHDAFSLTEYPYIVVCYRTDSPKATCDVSMVSEKGENWLTSMPAFIKDGNFHTMFFSIDNMTGNSSTEAPNEGSMSITVRLKPFGSGTKTISAETYFDLKYVGFFETAEEAASFTYPGDTSYPHEFEVSDIVADYSSANSGTVLSYIYEADERKNEIIHANNTVPYEDHLSFDGLTGAYSLTETSSKFTLTAPTGSYTDTTGVITFTQNDVDFSEFFSVKLSYSTTSVENAYVILSSSAGSASLPITLTAGSSVNELTFSIKSFNNYAAILGGSNVSLKLAPFGTGLRTLEHDAEFSIEYIGLFNSALKADAFEYTGENGANMTTSGVVYSANLLDPANTAESAYFVSSSTGSDSNDGLTPETAWASVAKVVSMGSAVENSVVYFKRGDTFRTTAVFSTKANTVYTTYGFGDKPKIVGSIDGTGASNWSETNTENVWVFSRSIANSTQNGDVGHIRINDGELWGIKVSVRNDSDMRVDNGDVYNGRTYIDALSNVAVNCGLGLYNDLEFHHDYTTGNLYLYCEDGNPGTVFDSIEIADKGNGLSGTFNNTTVDNLYITGFGSHGLGYGNITSSTVKNCHLEWIGGSIQTLNFTSGATAPTRFGNAIEAYGSASDFTIANCYCSQIYDCCYTVQNQEAVTFRNVFMYDNVAEYSNSGLEIWQNGGITDNLYLHDNYTLFGGYGWSHQRPLKDGNFFYGGIGIRSTTFTNCSVENNINVLASNIAILVSEIGSTRYNFNNNIYIMEEGKGYTYVPDDSENGFGTCRRITYNYAGINKIVSQGTDKNSKFYYISEGSLNIGDDPYKAFGETIVPQVLIDGDELDAAVSTHPSLSATKTYDSETGTVTVTTGAEVTDGDSKYILINVGNVDVNHAYIVLGIDVTGPAATSGDTSIYINQAAGNTNSSDNRIWGKGFDYTGERTIIDLTKYTTGNGGLKYADLVNGDTVLKIRIRPWNGAIPTGSTFSIAYAAFFDSLEDAEKYEYIPGLALITVNEAEIMATEAIFEAEEAMLAAETEELEDEEEYVTDEESATAQEIDIVE